MAVPDHDGTFPDTPHLHPNSDLHCWLFPGIGAWAKEQGRPLQADCRSRRDVPPAKQGPSRHRAHPSGPSCWQPRRAQEQFQGGGSKAGHSGGHSRLVNSLLRPQPEAALGEQCAGGGVVKAEDSIAFSRVDAPSRFHVHSLVIKMLLSFYKNKIRGTKRR